MFSFLPKRLPYRLHYTFNNNVIQFGWECPRWFWIQLDFLLRSLFSCTTFPPTLPTENPVGGARRAMLPLNGTWLCTPHFTINSDWYLQQSRFDWHILLSWGVKSWGAFEQCQSLISFAFLIVMLPAGGVKDNLLRRSYRFVASLWCVRACGRHTNTELSTTPSVQELLVTHCWWGCCVIVHYVVPYIL